MKATFFAAPDDFRAWLEKNHLRATELWVGFYKTSTGRPSITWPQSVDQALCFGWIDGLRKSLGDESYMIRFTPRKADSNWSAINVRRVGELTALGLMRPAGQKAFGERKAKKTAIYSYEQKDKHKLPPALEKQLRGNKKAWQFFQSCPPWYRRTAAYWVISAVKEETRAKRLGVLVAHSEAGRRIPPLTPPGK